ncbi:metallopeptidase family protein [Herbidospora galbida]|uniref:Metallopeptidase family protein n=2 Tax=Herbidospora TaxID=28443 RepID=A0A4U3MGU9_9ACTN|nr:MULTISPECIES: metallopeptidase family protein [Herbidospora]NAS24442.1 peptidase [Herbidospora solisilvae]TKK88421.1 metallopeptidase family protein [Herbidospora galbida]
MTPRRRDRHGRGMRGPLAPSHVPIAKSRGERFDDLVLDAVDRLRVRWAKELAAVDFGVEEVPPVAELLDGPARLASDPIPFGRAEPALRGDPAMVVVYRRPLEARARDRESLAALVHTVVVEQVSTLLGLTPEQVDPGYDG